MKYYAFFIAILCLVSFNAYAEEASPLPNCQIRIQHVSVDGQKEKIQFATHLNSRQECVALARIHERTVPPANVTNKKVAYKWKARGIRVAMRG